MNDQISLSPLLKSRLLKRRLKASCRRTFSNPWLYFMMALSLLAFATVHLVSRAYINSLSYDIPNLEVTSRPSCTTSPQSMLNLINQYRFKALLSALTLNDRLNVSAAFKNEDMVRYDYWAHISPSGTEAWDFMTEAGYLYTRAGENLAKDFRCNEEILVAWQRSKRHNDNLINTRYRDMGFDWSGNYATLHLGVR